MNKFYLVLFLFLFNLSAKSMDLIKFKSKDGVEISANLYMTNPDTATFIILFHQAGYSRGEYLEIGPKLSQMGYNCMAVDLRSGKEVNGVVNLTNQNAKAKMKDTNYLDAYQDMEAAIEHAKQYFAGGKLIIWGSSYSASLALKLASETDSLAGVIAFSPGEYFTNFGKPADFIASSVKTLKIPTFIAASKAEENASKVLFDAVLSDKKTFFIPTTSGNHGAKALWDKFFDSREYWKAITLFLEGL